MTNINIDYQTMDNNGRKFLTVKFCNVCGFFQSIGQLGHNLDEVNSNYSRSYTRLIIMLNNITLKGLGLNMYK
jgi:hypothetical protein